MEFSTIQRKNNEVILTDEELKTIIKSLNIVFNKTNDDKLYFLSNDLFKLLK